MANYKSIPSEMLKAVCAMYECVPFELRGIKVSEDHIKVILEILNSEESKSLPQNSRNEIAENTPDGLDKRMKIALDCDTRIANIVSDSLCEKGVLEIFEQENPQRGKIIKWTRLCKKWIW